MERIKTAAAAAILAIVIAATFPSPVRSAGMLGSSAVYTAAQAAAGARLYATQCSSCHGATLRGGIGPALIGDGFTAQWSGEPASDPYTMMKTNMPQGAPGSLKPAEYLDIMAFILQKNAFRAGAMPLTAARLQHVTLHAPPNSPPVGRK